MSDSPQNANDIDASSSAEITTELGHINEEMYKINFDLSEKNKTLSLLRKIDEIILSSVTDVQQIAQQVLDVAAVEADFKVAVLYLYEKEGAALKKVSVSRTDFYSRLLSKRSSGLFWEKIWIGETENSIAICFRDRKMQAIVELSRLLRPYVSVDEINQIEQVKEIASFFLYPLISRGEAIGVLIVGITETEEKLSSDRRELLDRLAGTVGIAIDNALLYQNLQAVNEQLKELDRLKDEFVSIASHELRTPMTAIRSYLWMALAGQGGVLNDKQRFYIQRGYNSVERLIKLVNDMLNVSRIESGRISLDMQKTNLATLVQEVKDEVSPRADELGLQVRIDASFVPSPVLADPDKIKEVLFNLVGNSLKFTPKDGTITVSFSEKNGMVEVRVTDTGAGIEAANIPNLFQKFGILPGSYTATQSAMGTGLGLYICKSIIQLHNGKIWAESKGKGQGTTFVFTLPVFNEDQLAKFREKHREDHNQERVGLEHTEL